MEQYRGCGVAGSAGTRYPGQEWGGGKGERPGTGSPGGPGAAREGHSPGQQL
ncbi:hypothetical protein I79_009924 [Cricetulus griseus]|uniref:Uncharacterized protein n=1 Tax=Cricetulus griseus TaxID=10029 RepID=G3HH29_CRIGR|nr:hypothetical protein I79_009924 [Cricetulus griseus]